MSISLPILLNIHIFLIHFLYTPPHPHSSLTLIVAPFITSSLCLSIFIRLFLKMINFGCFVTGIGIEEFLAKVAFVVVFRGADLEKLAGIGLCLIWGGNKVFSSWIPAIKQSQLNTCWIRLPKNKIQLIFPLFSSIYLHGFIRKIYI